MPTHLPFIPNFSERQISFKLKVTFSTNFRPKTKKIVRAVFEKNIKVSHFGLFADLFLNISKSRIFSQKSGPVTFLPLQSPNLTQKIREILRAISEKAALPTNQPTNYYQQHRLNRTWLMPVQKQNMVNKRFANTATTVHEYINNL